MRMKFLNTALRPYGVILFFFLIAESRITAQDTSSVSKKAWAQKADSLFKSGYNFFQQRKMDEAIQSWTSASEIFKNLDEKKAVLKLYGNLALAYKILNQMDRYRSFLDKQLRLSIQLDDKKTHASVLSSLGMNYTNDFQYDSAKISFDQALEIQKNISDKKEEANTYSRLGMYFQVTSDYKSALNSYRMAAAIHRPGGDRVELSNDLSGIGTAYRSVGKYDSSLLYLNEALLLKDSIKDASGKAQVLTQLGVVFDYQGQFETAEKYYRSALEICRAVKNEKGEADNLVNLGVVYHNNGNYQKAIDAYKEALAIHKRYNLKRSIAKDLSNMAVVYRDLNNLEDALIYLNQAVQIEKETHDKQGLSSHLSIIASIYWKKNDLYQAEQYMQQSLDLRKEIGDRRGESNDLIGLGWIQLQEVSEESENIAANGNIGTILKTFQEAYAIKTQIGDVNGEITALTYIAQTYRLLKDFEQAKQNYRQAFALAQDKKAVTLEWQIKYGLAKISQRQGLIPEAIFELREAVKIIEDQRVNLKSEEFRIGFFQDKSYVYSDLIEILVKNNNFEEAFNLVERSKSRSFLDLLGTKSLESSKKDNPLLAVIDSLDMRLNFLEGKISSTSVEDEQITFFKEMDSLHTERKKIVKSIQKSNEELSSLLSVSPLTLSDIKELLDDNLNLVEYYVTNKFYLIFLVSKTEISCVKMDISAYKFYGALLDFRNDLLNVKSNKHKKSSKDLYAMLLKPVEDKINATRLVIVPYGKLHYIPFSALTDARDTCLIDKFTISYLPSASLMKFVVNKRKKNFESAKLNQMSLLAFGNPSVPDLQNLTSAEDEVNYIAGLFSTKEVFLNANATENKVKTESAHFDIIHFACHGSFNLDEPSRSALYLAKGGADDGQLYANEIFGLKLSQAQLVILSACETGLSKIVSGDELIGLTRAFIYAGTPSLIASLWAVNDQSTGILLKNFYDNFKPGNKSGSLREAQLLLKSRKEFEHPYYWSCFGIVGDWK